MAVGSHSGSPEVAHPAFQGLNGYAGQALAVAAFAFGLGFAAAIDAYAAAVVFGSAAAAVLLGVLFIYRRFGTFIGIWLFFLLQPLLFAVAGEQSPPGRLIDVLDVPILLVVGSLGFLLTIRDSVVTRWLFVAGGVVLACGFASDVVNGVSVSQSVAGAALRMKFFLALAAGLAVYWTPARARRALKILLTAAVVAAVAGILDFASGGALRDVFAAHGPKAPRLGYVAAGGIFRNVAVLGTFMAIAVTVLLGLTWREQAFRRIPQLVLVGIAALTTLRLKAVVSIPAAAVALAITNTHARRRLVLVAVLGALAVLGTNGLITGVVDRQVERYTSETPQPRQRLQSVGIEIARDNFPLGVGFGQFGSAPSIKKGSYSPVYREYGLASQYGFRPSDPRYALDTSWPGLLGEVGILGSLAFGATMVALALLLFRRSQEGGAQADLASIGFGVMVVIFVDSLARATLFETFTVLTVALIVAPGLRLAWGRSTEIVGPRVLNPRTAATREPVI